MSIEEIAPILSTRTRSMEIKQPEYSKQAH